MTQNGNATILPPSVHMNPDTCFFLMHFFFFFICSTEQLCHTRHLCYRRTCSEQEQFADCPARGCRAGVRTPAVELPGQGCCPASPWLARLNEAKSIQPGAKCSQGQQPPREGGHSVSPEFLHLTTTDTVDQVVPCCGGCPVHYRVLSSIPGLY